jgi:hypothetical protein
VYETTIELKKERATACEEEWKRKSNAHKAAREEWAAQMGYNLKNKRVLLMLWKGSPLKAAIISEFQDKMGWTVDGDDVSVKGGQ